jgi:beta-glucosidase
MLFGREEFRGRLTFSWPADATGATLNVQDRGYAPLFPFGYGLKLSDRRKLGRLPENPGIDLSALDAPTGALFEAGRAVAPRLLKIDGANDSPQTVTGAADNGSIAITPVDRDRQEDARKIVWNGRGRGTLLIANPRVVDWHDKGPLALVLALKVDQAPGGPAAIELKCGPGCSGKLDVTSAIAALSGRGWQTLTVPLACIAGADLSRITAPFALTTSSAMNLTMSSIALKSVRGKVACP